MTRIVDRPVKVKTSPAGIPEIFVFRGSHHRVAVLLDTWRETGEWWDGAREKVVFRVRTTSGGIFELERESERASRNGGEGGGGNGDGDRGTAWRLYKVYD